VGLSVVPCMGAFQTPESKVAHYQRLPTMAFNSAFKIPLASTEHGLARGEWIIHSPSVPAN
jgi:hypothetical protein